MFAQLRRSEYLRLVVWADGKYHNHVLCAWLARHPRRHPWRLEIVSRPPEAKRFVLLPKRCVAEHTFAWLGRSRRKSKDCERRTDSSAARIQLTVIRHMLRDRLQIA